MKTAKIVIAHHHRILGQALEDLLSTQPDFLVVGRTTDISQAAVVAAAQSADVMIAAAPFDGSPDRRSSDMLILPLKNGVLPNRDCEDALRLTIDAGLEDLYSSLRSVLGAPVTMRDGGRSAATLNDFSTLTAREREIYGLLAGGMSNQQIGRQLFITERTVKYHVSNVLRKLNVNSRTEAAVRFMHAVG